MSTALRRAILWVKRVCQIKYSRQHMHKVKGKETTCTIAMLFMYLMSELVSLQRRMILSNILRIQIGYVWSAIPKLNANAFCANPFSFAITEHTETLGFLHFTP